MSRQLVLALLALLAAALLAPAAAPAVERAGDDVRGAGRAARRLRARGDAGRDRSAFGVKRVRALVYWRDFAARPNSTPAPSFDRADHTAYPAGTWDRLDRLVDVDPAARDRAAADAHRARAALGDAEQARPPQHARRARVRPLGHARSRPATATAVNLWSIWNEPNHPEFLEPQYKHGRPASPRIYRKLYVAAERAIHGVPGGAERQGAVRRDRADRQPEPRLAARLPARRDLPERALQARGRLRASCASTATRTTPTRARPARASSTPTPTTSASARSSRLVTALDRAAAARA